MGEDHAVTTSDGRTERTGGSEKARARLDVAEVTRRLVEAPSVNPGGDELRVAGVVDDVCRDLSLPAPRRVGLHDRPNLVIDVDFGGGGLTLALCGHLDTKPVGDGVWETDPFTVTEIDGELRGRGVVDMKGALAAMLLAATDLIADPPTEGRLRLVFCADEENGAVHGARLLTEHGAVSADAMIIGEPGGIVDDWDRLHIGSRGICNFDVEVTTEQAHSGLRDALSLPSATEIGARILLALADDLSPSVPDGAEWLPTMNAGVVIEGGTTYGVIPGRARIASDCRLVPGMEQERLLDEIRELVGRVTPRDTDARVVVRDWIPPMTIPADHDIVRHAADALASVIGSAPPIGLFPATTDASWFAASGIPALPALGPGLLRYAHGRDERISLEALGQARDVYRTVASSFLGGGS